MLRKVGAYCVCRISEFRILILIEFSGRQTDSAGRRVQSPIKLSNVTVVLDQFRGQSRNRGGTLPVLQRARPHLHHALQVRQAERDLLQVRHRGSAEV